MHPILDRRSRLLLYLAGWAILGTLLAGVLVAVTGRPFGVTELYVGPLTLIYANICLSAWWVCKAAPLDRTPLGRVLGTLLGTAVISALLWTALAAAWAVVLERMGWADPAVRGTQLGVILIAGAPLYLLSVVVHYLLIAFERAREAERRALEAAVVGREAELRALRAQIHPHFLFNSLNSINALVGQDPEGARRMCQNLGDFLRGTLNLAHKDRVPLAEELSLIERYLAIERVRFGERLGVEWVVAPDTRACLVPPLLLQPLVENAIKHGVSNRIEGGVVRIEAARLGDALRLAIENPVDEAPSARPGERMGLENVKQRLRALDQDGTRFEVRSDATTFRVVLTLPATEAGPAAAPRAVEAGRRVEAAPRAEVRRAW